MGTAFALGVEKGYPTSGQRIMISSETDRHGIAEYDFVELKLILPRWQLAALGELAERQGTRVGPLLRQILSDILGGSDIGNRRHIWGIAECPGWQREETRLI